MDLNILAHKAAYGNRGLTLENMDDDLPEGGDSALGSYAEQCDAAFEDSEVQSQALEAIRDYSDQLASMINRGECTPVALGLLRHNMQSHAQRMGRELVMPALEGIDAISIEAQSTIALESVKNFLNNVVQEFVIGFKHHKDLIGDFLRTTSEITAKYEKKSLENGRHWNQVKNDIDMSQPVSVGANGLFYFFAKGNDNPTVGKLLGQGKLIAALKEDVLVSKYILTQYPKVVMQEMKSLAAILRGASFKKAGDMVRMVAQVEKLKTPVELFDSKYHNAELLGAAKLHAAPNRPRKMQPATSHKPMPRMAEMAGAKHVGYKGQKSMSYLRGFGAATSAAGATALNLAAPGVGQLAYAVGKVATGLPMALATSHAETAYTFEAKEIPVILSIAEKYLDYVRGAVGYEREIVRVLDELDAAIERANDNSEIAVDAISAITDKAEADKAWSAYIEDCHLFEQVLAFANSLRRALQKPVHGEAARALRAAKYCNYLALRAIFNAERKPQQIAKEAYNEAYSAAMDKLDEDHSTELEKIEQELEGYKKDHEKAQDTGDEALYQRAIKGYSDVKRKKQEVNDKFHKARQEAAAKYKSTPATEGYDEDAQENIRKMDEALNAMHQKYESRLRAASGDQKKFAEIKGEQATEEFNIRQKFQHSHPKPATESIADAKFHKGQTVAGYRIVDVRMNGPKVQYLVKENEDKNEYATAEEVDGDNLNITHKQALHSDEKAREFYNFTGREKVSTEDYEEASPELKAKYEQTRNRYDGLKLKARGASGSYLESLQAQLSRVGRELRSPELWHLTRADHTRPALENIDDASAEVATDNAAPPADAAPAEPDDIHTKHAKRMKRLTEAHDQHQKLLKDADSPEKHAPAQEAVKTLVRQMQQALAEYLEQVNDEVAPPPDVE